MCTTDRAFQFNIRPKSHFTPTHILPLSVICIYRLLVLLFVSYPISCTKNGFKYDSRILLRIKLTQVMNAFQFEVESLLNSIFSCDILEMGQTPLFHRTPNKLKHHFSNIKRTSTWSSIGDQTRTPYFWL